MMRPLFFAATVLCLFAACRKAEDRMIIGKWKVMTYSYDTNHNRTLEVNEKIYTKADETFTYTFKGNGNLEIKQGKLVYPMTWNLTDGGKTLTMTLDGEDINAKVLELTNTDLTYETDADSLMVQLELKKQ